MTLEQIIFVLSQQEQLLVQLLSIIVHSLLEVMQPPVRHLEINLVETVAILQEPNAQHLQINVQMCQELLMLLPIVTLEHNQDYVKRQVELLAKQRLLQLLAQVRQLPARAAQHKQQRVQL